MYALILAGKRSDDPLSDSFGVSCKAFLPVAGKTSLDWVLDALSGLYRELFLSLEPSQEDEFCRQLVGVPFRTVPSDRSTPAMDAVQEALRQIPPGEDLLITTCDNPLLRPEIVRTFLSRCDPETELSIGVVNAYEGYLEAHGGLGRTWHKLGPQLWLSGANLFLWRRGPESVAGSAERLKELEKRRKHPLAFGQAVASVSSSFWWRLLGRRLNVADCSQALTGFVGISTSLVSIPYPEACIDIDKVEDYHQVCRFMDRQLAAVK